MKKILICLVLAVSLLVSANARADMTLTLIPENLFAHDDTLRAVATVVFWGEGNAVHSSILGDANDPNSRLLLGAGSGQSGATARGELLADFTRWTSPVYADSTNTWSAIRIWGTGNIANLQINGTMVSTDWLTDGMTVTSDWSADRGLAANLASAANDEWSFWYLINNDANEVLNMLFAVTRTNPAWLVGITIYESGNPSIIPEPATLAVVGLGLAGLGLARIRRKK